jgi:hypothetical protein
METPWKHHGSIWETFGQLFPFAQLVSAREGSFSTPGSGPGQAMAADGHYYAFFKERGETEHSAVNWAARCSFLNLAELL